MTTALLMGGKSPEREVSLMSGEQVLSALRSRGEAVLVVDPAVDENWMQTLSLNQVTRVFNILHGGSGENGEIRGALNCVDIPCTGSGVLGSALAMNKHLAKMVWRAAGVATPDWRLARAGEDAAEILDALSLPLFVKPAMGGSSTSTTAVEDAADLPAAIETAAAETGAAIVETLARGDEYTLSILEDQTLPLIQIKPAGGGFYDYQAKYVAEDTEFICPTALPKKQAAALAAQGLAAFQALQCGGWGRLDFILPDSGAAQFLEVNTVPGMTSHSLVPMAAKAAGIEFDELVARILAGAEVTP